MAKDNILPYEQLKKTKKIFTGFVDLSGLYLVILKASNPTNTSFELWFQDLKLGKGPE